MKKENKRDLIMLGELLKVERDLAHVNLVLKSGGKHEHEDVHISFFELDDRPAGEQEFSIHDNASYGYTAKVSDVKLFYKLICVAY